MIPHENHTNILKLDIDNPSKYSEESVRAKASELGLSIDAITTKPSKSLGIHVFIYLRNPISIDLVPFYESVLGSDLIRSCLINWRIRHNAYLDVFFNSVSMINMPIAMSKSVSDVIKFMKCRCPELLEKLLWFHNNDTDKLYRFISENIYE